MDVIPENRSSAFEISERVGKGISTVKNVVSKNESYRVRAYERLGDEKRLGNPFRFGLFAIFNPQAPAGAVAERCRINEAVKVTTLPAAIQNIAFRIDMTFLPSCCS